MQEQIDALKTRMSAVEDEVKDIRSRQSAYVDKHNGLEISFTEMRADLHHVRKAVDEIKSGINKAIWTFIGGFILAAVAWIVAGGLAL